MIEATRTCETCGRQYTPRRKDQRHCDKACALRHKRPRDRYIHARTCERCGIEWLAGKPTHRYCSKRCATLSHYDTVGRKASGPPSVRGGPCCRLSARPKPRTWINGRCQRCDRTFTTCGARLHKYCSRRCMHKAHKGANKGAKIPNALRLQVLRRDGYVCRICRKPIHRHRAPPHPKAASIDHILPQSHGGDDAETNLQAAHYGCNSSKGNRVTQLRLGC